MRSLALITLACLVAAPALAGQSVTLRPQTLDLDGQVTLSDLFEQAGAAGSVLVARREAGAIVLDAGAVQLLARRNGLDWANPQGMRRIVVTSAAPVAHPEVEVLTYARNLAAGEVIQPEDLVWSRASFAPQDAPSDSTQFIGMIAKRPLRAGSVVNRHDGGVPLVVKAGDMVTITYAAEGITLSLEARATSNAGLGEAFTAQNPTSKKIVQAIAAGPGQGRAGPNSAPATTTRPAQLALR